jgi:hypothetical protein
METDGRYEDCLRLRAQVGRYIERFLKKREFCVETAFSERSAKFYYRPEDGKTRSLTIVGYWDEKLIGEPQANSALPERASWLLFGFRGRASRKFYRGFAVALRMVAISPLVLPWASQSSVSATRVVKPSTSVRQNGS